METKRIKGLDTLRALAALVVVFDHIEIIKQTYHIYNLIDFPTYIYPDSHLSVMLFFVISGFLITYLLLVEREKNGFISIKNFYRRRVLRIWPLYFLVLLLSYVIFQPDYSWLQITLPVLILPNIAFAIKEVWDVSPQIWSIGAEEQFYIFWPVLFIFLIKRKKFTKNLVLIILFFTLLPFILKTINVVLFQSENFNSIISRFFYGTKFNSILTGALVGYLYFKKIRFFKSLNFPFFKYFLVILPFVLWFFKLRFAHLTDEFYSVLFSFSIYHIVSDKRIKIDFAVSNFLGRISYGIYLYHWIIIVLLIKAIPKLENQALYNLLLYGSAFSLTIAISWLSYVTFERFFLKMKRK